MSTKYFLDAKKARYWNKIFITLFTERNVFDAKYLIIMILKVFPFILAKCIIAKLLLFYRILQVTQPDILGLFGVT